MKHKKLLWQYSLFVKIIIAFIAGHLLFGLSQWNLRNFFFKNFHKERIHNTADVYSDLLINKIGFPPDTAVARDFAENNNVNIRIQNDTLNWANHFNAPEFSELELSVYKKRPKTHIGFDRGLNVITVRGNTKYLISIEKEDEDFVFYDHLFFAITFLIFTLVMYIIYRILKRLLSPLKQLREGVEKVSKGDFGNEIKTTRNDELGILVKSFNTMSKDVHEMIKQREQLILNVSHELKTPLTRMKLALEFLEDSEPKKDISDDVNELETMTTEILETERLSSIHGGIKKETVVLNDILEVITIDNANFEPGVELKANGIITITGDNERLRTLFRNIVANALKYSSGQSKPVEINLAENKTEVEITCRDFGEGIPANELKNIFEPFYRVDKSRSKETGGYGLGMHLVKIIVDAHSGKIDVSSKLNEGTVIKIVLPKLL